ncbi:MAG: hypothetical protein KUA30_10590, partial [Candidatus Desulforudis sp.]|nr:hypothetical protein [Bacillota bacterium]MBV1770659.1 hypothetical protein [Desulforudis sp.]
PLLTEQVHLGHCVKEADGQHEHYGNLPEHRTVKPTFMAGLRAAALATESTPSSVSGTVYTRSETVRLH